MSNTGLKVAAVSVLLSALAMALLWQQARISRLMAEAVDLRVQLGQAISPLKENGQLANVQPSTDQHLAREQFRELLRLRGEVGVLRRQLAEALKPDSALRVASKTMELEPSAQPEARRKAGLVALDARLRAQEQKVDAAKQKVADLLVALNVPKEVSNIDEAVDLDSEDVKQYRSYFEAKKELAEDERFTQILRLKVRSEHLDAGDNPGGGSSR